MPNLTDALTFARGPAMRNRFMLAPLTNKQSHQNGQLSDEERNWLVMRAKGGFGLVMTCAAHVQPIGQGFPGQMGIFSDEHVPALTDLAVALRAAGALSSVQLYHAGLRSPKELIGQAPVGPSDDAETGSRALSTGEVEQLTEDFIAAAHRADLAGFDGVELHGAHSYIFCAFLSDDLNRRTDRYGGSLENRSRLLRDVIGGIRARCRPDFQLGVRLSAEGFGLSFPNTLGLVQELMTDGALDYLDMSLWNCFKTPIDSAYSSRRLVDCFANLPRGQTRLGGAGRIRTAEDCQRLIDAGCDFVLIGRAAILHHDFPKRVIADPRFEPMPMPVSSAYLAAEGLSPPFIEYMREFAGFVMPEGDKVDAPNAVVI